VKVYFFERGFVFLDASMSGLLRGGGASRRLMGRMVKKKKRKEKKKRAFTLCSGFHSWAIWWPEAVLCECACRWSQAVELGAAEIAMERHQLLSAGQFVWAFGP
jgi:hypothetical protein